MDLTASVGATIDRYALISPGSKVLVAISGGPDSVALLHCLKSIGFTIEAAHLNHQFRGAESDGDAEFVTELCDSLSIKLTAASEDVPHLKAKNKVSAQQAARSARYAFLEQARVDGNLDLIATAHNSDDRVETVLLNIVRGTGVDGLRGIPFRRGKVIRPLLETPRSSVDAYLHANNLKARTDSSNKLSKYARNSVRSELLPYLERRFNPAVRNALTRLSHLAADESDYLNDLAESWLAGQQQISVTNLLAQPPALQRRILREWLRLNAKTELTDVTHVLIEQFRMGLNGPCAVTLPGAAIVAESDGNYISVRKLPELTGNALTDIPLQMGQAVLFGDYRVTVVAIGAAIESGSLYVRQWRDGDRITLKGGTRKVQDVFTDQKVPREVRRCYPLVADALGIIAIGDIRVAARAAGTVVTVVKAD